MKEFYTRESHNKGSKLELYLPNGNKSEHYLSVVGAQSDAFRKSKAQVLRDAAESINIGEFNQDESQAKMLASAIESWSFKEECTDENKINFLINAPYIMEALDRFIIDSDNFTKK